MTSCEPTRCSAYSEDLRWRIVWQTEALRYTSDQVAKELTRMRVALHYCLVQEPCKPLYTRLYGLNESSTDEYEDTYGETR